MNIDDDLRAALGRKDESLAGDGFEDVRARADRLRRRHRVRRTGMIAAAIVVVVGGGAIAGRSGDGGGVDVGDAVPTTPEPTGPAPTSTTSSEQRSVPEPTTPRVPATAPTTQPSAPDAMTTEPALPDTVPTTEPNPPSTTAGATDDEAAAAAFIDAWRQGDAATMRQLTEPREDMDLVDVALAPGNAQGESECTTQSSGQYQCAVDVSNGQRMYILVGEPGAQAGRVWWVGVVTH